MHCVDPGHDTWGDQDNKEEEGGDEVDDWEGYKVKFSTSFEDGGTKKVQGNSLNRSPDNGSIHLSVTFFC